MFIIILMSIIAVLSFIALIYCGSKYAVADGVTPQNASIVNVSIVVSGLFFLFALICLILAWLSR